MKGVLKAIFDPAMLKAGLYAAGGGAGYAVAYDLIVDTTSGGAPIFNAPWKKGALAAGLGVGLGAAAWKFMGGERGHDLAKGALGATGAELGRQLLRMVRQAAGAVVAPTADAAADAMKGLRSLGGPMGNSTEIEEQRRVGGVQLLGGTVDVEDVSHLAAWQGG